MLGKVTSAWMPSNPLNPRCSLEEFITDKINDFTKQVNKFETD